MLDWKLEQQLNAKEKSNPLNAKLFYEWKVKSKGDSPHEIYYLFFAQKKCLLFCHIIFVQIVRTIPQKYHTGVLLYLVFGFRICLINIIIQKKAIPISMNVFLFSLLVNAYLTIFKLDRLLLCCSHSFWYQMRSQAWIDTEFAAILFVYFISFCQPYVAFIEIAVIQKWWNGIPLVRMMHNFAPYQEKKKKQESSPQMEIFIWGQQSKLKVYAVLKSVRCTLAANEWKFESFHSNTMMLWNQQSTSCRPELEFEWIY